MPMSVRQSRGGLWTIVASIQPGGVHYREGSLLRRYETTVKFEEIPDEVTRTFTVSRLHSLVVTGIGLFFVYRMVGFLSAESYPLSYVVWSGALVIWASFGAWVNSPRLIGYAPLMFFDTSGADDPTGFLEEIQQAKREYLAAVYGPKAFPDRGPLQPSGTESAQLH